MLRVSRKNAGRITFAPITELAPAVRWIDAAPKDVEQFLVAHLSGVEANSDGFEMPGIAGDNLFIFGIISLLMSFSIIYTDLEKVTLGRLTKTPG